MYPFYQRICSLALFILAATGANAQMPLLKVAGADAGKVYLQKLDIDVQVTGTVAATTWEMTFMNTTDRTLEGELNFPLPDGTDITGYALDINGRMRDAVPVEKAKGTRTFEAVEHRRVDPGLLEKTEGNNFRTRIYPIGAHGTRTVRIRYEEELQPRAQGLDYSLPLSFADTLESLGIKLSVLQSPAKPVLAQSPADGLQFAEWQHNYTASKTYRHVLANKPLLVHIPQEAGAEQVIMQQEGNRYIYLINTTAGKTAVKKTLPKHITVLWDASLSGLQRNLKKELEVLNTYLSAQERVTLTLVVFSNTIRSVKDYTITKGNTGALLADLKHTIYDGGTKLGALHLNTLPGDEFLLFSDGHNTFGAGSIKTSAKPVYCISSSPMADFAQLKKTALQTGGNFLDLQKASASDIRKALFYQPYRFIGIKKNTLLEENYPSAAIVSSNFSLAGYSSKPQQDIVLQFGYGNKVTEEKKIHLDFYKQAVSGTDLQRIWARKKIAELDMDFDNNKKTIEQLGKKYGIVTRNTSLIVLENVNDYVQHGIEPPAELREEYDRIVKEQQETKTAASSNVKNNAEQQFNDLVKWWHTDFSFKPKPRPAPKPRPVVQAATPANAVTNHPATAPAQTPATQTPVAQTSQNTQLSNGMGEVYGTVLDEKKEPMIGAVVQLEQGGIARGGASTDIDGNYSIKPLQPGSYNGRISSAGYKVAIINGILVAPNTSVRVNKSMEVNDNALKGITVIAESQYRPPLTRNMGATRTFVTQDVHNFTSNNLNDAAAAQLGTVQAKSGGSLNIGGARSEGTIYIIDGVQLQGNPSGYASPTPGIEELISGFTGNPAANEDEEEDDEDDNFAAAKKRRYKKDYIAQLKRTTHGNQYTAYLQLRKTHMGDPVFYFTVAGYFLQTGRKEIGIRILSNMAELSFQDHEVYKMLGYKLRETGQKDAAVYVFGKVMEWRPDEPQSYRDYALALADAGYTQRALDTLYYALDRKYDADIMSKYDGIEEIIVTEINQLIAASKTPLHTGNIPHTLVKNMPVDARVVINWNMDDTDIDLWVTDPEKEKCYYSHKETAAGGRISDDFTQGYGPEQFMIKKARKGKYKIEINYFGDQQLRLAGPTTVFAEIYTHYGTPRQQRRLIALQLKRSGEDQTAYIGEFVF